MSNTNTHSHEHTIELPPGRTILVFGKDVVSDLVTSFKVAYLQGHEKLPDRAPWIIALNAGLNTIYEARFTDLEMAGIIRRLVGWMKSRERLPHGVSDLAAL